jgi:hypothetical protein
MELEYVSIVMVLGILRGVLLVIVQDVLAVDVILVVVAEVYNWCQAPFSPSKRLDKPSGACHPSPLLSIVV